MESEAPCCGGGLPGFYSLHILIFDNPQIQHFPVFPKFSKSLPLIITQNVHLKTFEKSSKNSQIIIEPKTLT